MKEQISTLSAEMEKLLNRIESDLTNFLVGFDGSLKDIASGTRIKIPTDVGYVSCFKSVTQFEISIWLKETWLDKLEELEEPTLENYNKDDEC